MKDLYLKEKLYHDLPDGSMYHGQMRNGERHGFGILVTTEGHYEGYWSNDKAEGISTFNYFNGDFYSGQWSDDQPNGYGVYLEKDQSKYEGNFINGQKSG